ncbi:glycosyltransferase family 9 protein [Thiovibrio frasassiensis]|uniref:Glycosyltransferase family 9 protein n=1 Tax=Thiovibrio frasassiensis TaxID=2984131 RepID=A0A9X4MI45_9BACT|nr:glycosyltransferase family 9 protein [Thiovibrio frasassiensis]MDG4476290.1 glycosyltransferase family 9 protein [Thiovibrio frasassiensis]
MAVWDKAAELLEDCSWLDQVVAVTKRSRSRWDALRFQVDFFRTLRSSHCDLAIDLRSGTRSAILAFLSGASQRIGFYAADGKLWRNRLFTSLVHHDYTPDQHVIDYLLALLEAFGITTNQRSPELAVAATKQEAIRGLLEEAGVSQEKKLVAVQPFSLWHYKEWGEEKYISLIRWLVAEYGVAVLVTGSAVERERAEEIVRRCGAGCYNLAGKTSLATYAALLQKCHFFVGVDSAGLHIAAAVGTVTLGIFGPSSPESWAPKGGPHRIVQKKMDCVPCRQKGCDNSEKSRCLDELTQDEVRSMIAAQQGGNSAKGVS